MKYSGECKKKKNGQLSDNKREKKGKLLIIV